ncbi:MAG: helix-turn-helix domain-containing protein [Chloroflexota bacterium]|nr:helix-turn-helix domain-containing protein [Chloroflexota bacterium]
MVTVADVARLTTLHENTVRAMIREGDLPALHHGRRVLVRRTDLQAFLDARIGADQPIQAMVAIGGAR